VFVCIYLLVRPKNKRKSSVAAQKQAVITVLARKMGLNVIVIVIRRNVINFVNVE
jgi:hypothetical protein